MLAWRLSTAVFRLVVSSTVDVSRSVFAVLSSRLGAQSIRDEAYTRNIPSTRSHRALGFYESEEVGGGIRTYPPCPDGNFLQTSERRHFRCASWPTWISGDPATSVAVDAGLAPISNLGSPIGIIASFASECRRRRVSGNFTLA